MGRAPRRHLDRGRCRCNHRTSQQPCGVIRPADPTTEATAMRLRPQRRTGPRAPRSLPARTGWRLACAAVVLAVTASLLGAPAANAEVEHPRQRWLRQSTAGLFLHWGMFTAPRHLDCAGWERDVTEGGWTAEYWVDEARKLGASYIVLATFHSRLGYARPWPSQIPGSCATERDLLGELIEAGKAKDIK